ncbi:hypothetical protein [Ensifer sp.]|jgi:hypothetical protein|uniref:hypothetical protein n=1 Tax=Ensifer sp. TaxID=1872086 RepID=UPI002E150714|nr:hypothetical protein [Ensifer sp.]
MTTISPSMNAAIEILRRTVEPDQDAGVVDASDGILKAANGISAEPGRATTQATDAINRSLLETKARADAFIGTALEFVNSDRFKVSDPAVKETLKALLSENGEFFAARMEAELANDPDLRREEAMAIALTETVRSNRSRFGEGEIVLGYDLKDVPNQIHYVADVEGHTSGGFLAQAENEARTALGEAQKWQKNAKDGAKEDAGVAVDAAERRHRTVFAMLQEWNTMWAKKFGWKDEPVNAR